MLYMYEKRKNPREDSKGEELLLCVSAVAAPGSVFILSYVQFMEDIENNNSSVALIQDDAMLQQHWKKMFGIIYMVNIKLH